MYVFLTFFYVFFKIQKNMTFYVFFELLHTFSRTVVLTSHCNFKTYVNVPYVNIYHIESVLGHRRRTTTYIF